MRVPAIRFFLGLLTLGAFLGLVSCGDDTTTNPGGNNPPGDTTPPTVTATLPADGASGISPNATVSVIFSEAMDPATADSNGVTLSQGSITQREWSDDHTLILHHTDWSENSPVTVTVSTALSDTAGNHLASPFSFGFTVSTVDTIPPTIVSTSPADGAVDVAPDADLVLVFDEAMQPTLDNRTFTLSEGSIISMHWADDRTFVATHTPWPPATTITLTARGYLFDLAGNTFADQSWSFTTRNDSTPPTIVSIDPPTGSVIDANTSQITITFSEAIDPSSFDVSEINVQLWTHVLDPGSAWSPDGTVFTVPLRTPLPAGMRLRTVISEYSDLGGNWNTDTTPWEVTVAGTADEYPVDDTLRFWFADQGADDQSPVWDGSWGYHNRTFAWETPPDFRQIDMPSGQTVATDWQYMTKLANKIQFRGFREHDQQAGMDFDFMFNPPADYVRLPITLGDSWAGQSTITTSQGTVDLDYNVQVAPQTTEVDLPFDPASKRGFGFQPGTRYYWSDCRTLYIYHDMLSAGDTLEVGIDTLQVAPGMGIVQESSRNDDHTDGSWSWNRSYLFMIEPR